MEAYFDKTISREPVVIDNNHKSFIRPVTIK